MTDIVKGMALHVLEKSGDTFYDEHSLQFRADELRSALLFLADNVSDEMVRSASEDRAKDDEGQFQPLADLIDFSGENKTRTVIKSAIAAAIRAAAGEEGK